MSSYSRRQLMVSGSAFTISLLSDGCTTASKTASGGSAFRIGWQHGAPNVFSNDPQAYTPLGGSVCRYLESTGKSSVTAVYRGRLAVSKLTTGGFNSGDRRAGELLTTVRYSKGSSGYLNTQIAQKLNGVVIAGEKQPPFSSRLVLPVFSVITQTAVRFSDVPATDKGGVPVDLVTGIGAPELEKTISRDGLSVRLSRFGTAMSAPLGKSVRLWKWSGVQKNEFRSGQQMHVENLVSAEIPGQIHAYSYRYIQDGRLVDESSGQLVDLV